MATRSHSTRSGATLVESAITLTAFLLLVVGMLDIGIAVLRFNSISQAARQGARAAIVHGDLAPTGWRGGNWGTATLTVTPTDTGETSTPAGALSDAVRPSLSACPLEETTVTVEWLNGSNRLEQPVRVTVTTIYHPVLTFLFGNPGIELRASATMPMAHSRAIVP